jgi:hypothetical protein
MLITKSKFLAGNQCLKRLYWIVHSPELAAQADESDQSIIEEGREVGLLARQMFPGGVAVESRDREQAIRATGELIANPEVPAIFEGAFEYRDVFVRVDILHRPSSRVGSTRFSGGSGTCYKSYAITSTIRHLAPRFR